MLSSSSEVVIQTVAASGARVAARKIRISLLRSRFTRSRPAAGQTGQIGQPHACLQRSPVRISGSFFRLKISIRPREC